MAVRYWVVDAFTDLPFAGNPAAVVELDADADPGWMQSVATEFALSETAFLVPDGRGWGLRWFTPTVEVDLCGHATLASTKVLLDEVGAASPVRFATRSGELVGVRDDTGRVSIDLPTDHVTERLDVTAVAAAAGVDEVVAAGRSGGYVILELATTRAVRDLVPDMDAMAAFHPHGVVVTAHGDQPGIDIVSRMFAPSVGIPEDPVTGSAHCALAPWWAARLGPTLQAEQASPRGGRLAVRLDGERVHLAGDAVVVAAGRLHAMP